jgi:sterol desaturase/sphingolipid hydroxylase (fatty acid hydroxylase superfamily)
MAVSTKWQLSPLEYKIDFIVAPMLFGIAVWLSPSPSLLQIFLGALIWSLLEYAAHRFLFHSYFRRDHWAHHVDPTAYIGISGIYIGIAYAALLLPVWWLGLQSFYAGFMLGYFLYVLMHFVMHRPEHKLYRLLKGVARNHEMHHLRGLETNFGVTSPLWDLIFLSYSRPGARP